MSSLQLLPDISNWDISKIDNFDLMFYNCFSLSPFPNLNNWMNNNKFINSLIFGLSYTNLREINSLGNSYPNSQIVKNYIKDFTYCLAF